MTAYIIDAKQSAQWKQLGAASVPLQKFHYQHEDFSAIMMLNKIQIIFSKNYSYTFGLFSHNGSALHLQSDSPWTILKYF